MVRVVEHTEEPLSNDEAIIKKFSEWSRLKQIVEDFTKKMNGIRDELAPIIEQEDHKDDKGNFRIDLPEPVDGYVALQRQRRVSQKLDIEAAEELLSQRQLKDRCYKMVPVLDEDEVMACLYEDLLSPEDVDTMFPKTITYAFVPTKK